MFNYLLERPNSHYFRIRIPDDLREKIGRRNCYDNAVAESFFQLLKRERIRRRIYVDREEACRDVFDYIEMFYNTTRRHGYNNSLSPVEFEK
jgi:putative transposase